MRISTFLILAGLCLGIAGSARAQDAPPVVEPPAFPHLFPQPTGANGYEEWVQAGDLIRDNTLLADAMNADATLTFKRKVLADPAVQQALRLLREGLNKPVFTPHAMPNENTQFLEMTLFRKLARILNIQIYVQFAEGRVDAAIDTLAEGLNFGYRMQTNTLLSGLVGIAVDSIVLKGFSRQLEQLSEYQCQRVRRVVEDWMEWPSPLTILLNSEKQMAIRSLETKRNDASALKQLFSPADETEPALPATPAEQAEQARIQKLRGYLDGQPADLGRVIDEAKAMLGNHFDMMIANMKLPVTERKPFVKPEGKTMGGILTALVSPTFTAVMDRYDQLDGMLRLLGTHAAICSYRWEHNRLPATLAELRLGKMGTDPFTGASLIYKRKDTLYDLHSRGPHAHDDNGDPTSSFSELSLPTAT